MRKEHKAHEEDIKGPFGTLEEVLMEVEVEMEVDIGVKVEVELRF